MSQTPYSSMNWRSRIRALAQGLALVVALGVARDVEAQTIWDGGTAGSANWSDDTNWDNDTDVANDTALTFGAAGAVDLVNNNDNELTDVNSITFANSAGFDLQGTALNLNAGGFVNNNVDGTNTISLNLTFEGATSFTSIATGANNLAIGGTVNNGGFLLTVNGAGNTTITNVVSGGGGLTKDGTGTLSISGTNTYAGVTTVTNGMLRLGAAGVLADAGEVNVGAAGTLNLNGNSETIDGFDGAAGGQVQLGAGTLTVGSANTGGTFAGVISGTGGLTKSGTGTQILSGANTYTGATTVNNGVLTLGAANVLADATDVNVGATGTLNLNNNSDTVDALDGAAGAQVQLGTGTLTTGGNNGGGTFAGVISGTGDFTKSGTGTLTLSGTNTYSGTTTVSGGTLRLGASNVIANASNLELSSATSVLDLNGNSDTIDNFNGVAGSQVLLGAGTLTTGGDNNGGNFAGVISGTGGFIKSGNGTQVLGGANTFGGAVSITGGSLAVSDVADTGTNSNLGTGANVSTISINNGELTFTPASADSTNRVLDLTGTSTVHVVDAAGALTLTGATTGTGLLNKIGAGTLVLGAANGHTGGTTLGAGTVRLTVANALGNTGAQFVRFNGGNLDLGGAFTLANNVDVTNNGTFQTNGNDTTFNGLFTGNQTIDRLGLGTVTLTANSAAFAGTFDNNVGTVLFSGTGALGAATAAAGTFNNVAGASLIGSGTIGTLNNSGTLSPGTSVGTMNVFNFNNGATGTYVAEVNVDGTRDQVIATNNVALNGTLSIQGDQAVQASYFGKSFDIITADSNNDQAGSGFTDATFDTITSNFTFLAPTVTLIDNGDNAADFLRVSFNSFATPINTLADPLNTNQVAAANAIQRTFELGEASAEFAQAINQLFIITPAEAQAALTQIAGEARAATVSATLASNALVGGRVLGQLGSLRMGMSSFGGDTTGSTSYGPGDQYSAAPKSTRFGMGNFYNAFGMDSMTSSLGSGALGTGEWDDASDDQVWVLGTGLWGDIDPTSVNQGFDYDGSGFTLGYSWQADDTTLVGLHAGFNGTSTELQNGLDQVDTDSFNIGAHGSWSEDGTYVDGAVGYVSNDFNSQRFLTFGTGAAAVNSVASGDYSGDEFYLYVEGGQIYELGEEGEEEQWHVQPQLAAQYRSFSQDQYTETGAGPLNLTVLKNDLDMFQTGLGARFFYTSRTESGGWIVPDLMLRWGHEFGDIDRTVNSTFVGTSTVFQTNGRKQDRDTLQVRAGLTAYTVEDWNFDVSYNGELASGQNNHAGVVRAVYRF